MANYGYSGTAPDLTSDSVSVLCSKFKATFDDLFTKLNTSEYVTYHQSFNTMEGENTITLTSYELPSFDGLNVAVYRNGMYQDINKDYTLSRTERKFTFKNPFAYNERITIMVSAVMFDGMLDKTSGDQMPLPSPQGNSGKILTSDGSSARWADYITLNKTVTPTSGGKTITLEENEMPENDGANFTVFRNGLLQNMEADYSFDEASRTLTFTKEFKDNERVTIMIAAVSLSGDYMSNLVNMYSAVSLKTGSTAATKDASDSSRAIATTKYVKNCVVPSTGSNDVPVYTDSNGVLKASTNKFSNYLPLSGGVMTGDLKCSTVRNSENNGVTEIDGSSDSQSGAMLKLGGKLHSMAGGFELTAQNGSTISALAGTAAGSLKWKDNEVATTAYVASYAPHKPQTGTGVGQVTILTGAGSVLIPSGGTWFYMLFSGGYIFKTGVTGGGATLSESADAVQCFAWRIA